MLESNFSKISGFFKLHDKLMLWLLFFINFSLFLLIGFLRCASFTYGKWDTALWEQGLWLSGHMKNTASTVYPGLNVFLGNHFMPAGFFYGLSYRIYNDILTTVFIDALHVSLAIFPLYAAGKQILNKGTIALGFCMIYLVSYTARPMHFYFENLMVPFVALALFWTLEKRYPLATLAWVFAMMFKEYVALVLSVTGVLVYIKYKRKKVGIVWFFMGIMWFIMAYFLMRKIQPQSIHLNLFSYLGYHEVEIFKNIFFKPHLWLKTIFRIKALHYIRDLLIPLCFLPALGGEFLIPAIPVIMINILAANDWAIKDSISHYTIMITPFFIVAGIVGFHRIANQTRRNRRIAIAAFKWIFIFGLIFLNIHGVRHYGYNLKEALIVNHIFKIHSEDVKEIKRHVPQKASVACVENLLPYFSHREKIYRLVISADRLHLNDPLCSGSDYIIYDTFYDAFYHDMLTKALNTGFGALKEKPQLYYSHTMFQSITKSYSAQIDWLKKQGYVLKQQRGSILLFAVK